MSAGNGDAMLRAFVQTFAYTNTFSISSFTIASPSRYIFSARLKQLLAARKCRCSIVFFVQADR